MIFKDDLIRILNDNGFEYFVEEHAPLFTVEDSKSLRGQIEGAHSKNLFLKDAKANFFLISIEESASIDLKKTMQQIQSKKLSFAKTEYLQDILGIEPGSVSPFALLNDTKKQVKFYLDRSFLDSAYSMQAALNLKLWNPLQEVKTWSVEWFQKLIFPYFALVF